MAIYEVFVDLRHHRNIQFMNNLTPQEEEVMRAIWNAGSCTVKDILEQMPQPAPPYTTVASIVKNLVRKEYVTARKIGNTYLYTPAIDSGEFKRRCLGDIVKDYFCNSYKEMVTFFAREKSITPEELEEIVNLIKKGKEK